MKWFNDLKLKYKFVLVLILVVLGMALFAVGSYQTVEEVKINSEMYRKIINSKDLIADILPPPDYIVETHLICFQMLDEYNQSILDELFATSKRLREEFETRHKFWRETLEENRMKQDMVINSYKPAVEYYDLRDSKFIPLIKSGEREEAKNLLLSEMKSKYDEHRRYVDLVVESAVKHASDLELEAGDMVSSKIISLIIIGIVILTILSIIIIITTNRVSKPINQLSEAAEKIIAGDLEVSVEVKNNDEIGQLAKSFNYMVEKNSGLIEYLDNLPAPVMVVDREFNIQYMNKKGADLLGKEQKQLAGQKCYDNFKTGDCRTDKCSCAQAMNKNITATEETIANPNGKTLPILYSGIPVKNKSGSIVGALELSLIHI